MLTIKRRLKKKMNLKKLTLLSLVMTVFLAVSVLAVQPFGAAPSQVKPSERAPIDAAQSYQSLAGNTSEIDISGYSPTQTWQGYFGNVSGTVQLADASDNVMYDWSLASPEGEVYASRNGTLDWTLIQCFNYTATGAYGDDSATAGDTSLTGMNLTQLEAAYNIASDDVDGVDETFTLNGSHESGEDYMHDMFYVNNLQFTEGECLSTSVFTDSDSAENNTFEEVLLYEPIAQQIIFAAILDEEDTTGFDSKFHDFEMLVLEDGHGTDIAETTYYFYVELE